MTRLFRIVTLTLALLIAVTSQHMAMARGVMAHPAGDAILCTGHGPQTVTLDRSGVPMKPVQFCPDCALTMTVAIEAPSLMEPVFVYMQTLTQYPVPAVQNPVIPKPRRARGPPVLD